MGACDEQLCASPRHIVRDRRFLALFLAWIIFMVRIALALP